MLGTGTQVLLGVGDGIIVVDSVSASRVGAGKGAIKRLAVAPDGQFVAAFTDEGRLIVWLADFTRNLSEFSTESDTPPSSLAWCGTESVAMAWPVCLPSFPLVLSASETCSFQAD